MFNAVERDEDVSEDLAKDDTFAIDAALEVRDTGDAAVIKVEPFRSGLIPPIPLLLLKLCLTDWLEYFWNISLTFIELAIDL